MDDKENDYIQEFPRHDDQLFKHGCEDWCNNACVNYGFNKFNFYADGYREAANVLVKECLEDRGVNDIYVYPIVFLYRQYIELRLKELIIGLQYCLAQSRNFPQNHKIDLLWKAFIDLYVAIEEDIDSDEIRKTEELIIEFARVDPDSFAFRYPEDKKGKKTVQLKLINLRNLGEVMDRVARLLDAISDQIAHYKDLSDDMRADA